MNKTIAKGSITATLLLCLTLLASACGEDEKPLAAVLTDAEKELVDKFENAESPRAKLTAVAELNDYLRDDPFRPELKALEGKENVDAKLAAIEARRSGLNEIRAEEIGLIWAGEVDAELKKELLSEWRLRVANPFIALMERRQAALDGLFEKSIEAQYLDLKALRVYPDEDEKTPHALARTMNEEIVAFYGLWTSVQELDKPVEQTITPFVLFKQGSELPEIQGFKSIADDAQQASLMLRMRRFAHRYPDSRVAAWVKSLPEVDDDGRSHMQVRDNPLAFIGDTTTLASPEEMLANGIVEDLIDVYGKDLQPVKAFRVDLVKQFADESNLMNPNPWAMVLAIFGSTVLFGGLAFSIFRAVRSSRKERLKPRNEEEA